MSMTSRLYTCPAFPGRELTTDDVRRICKVPNKVPIMAHALAGKPVGKTQYVFTPIGRAPRIKPAEPPPDTDAPATRETTPAIWRKPLATPMPSATGFRMAHETIDDLPPINGQRIAAGIDPEPRV